MLVVSAHLGVRLRTKARQQPLAPESEHAERNDLSTILAATLTLLGLILGFSFSMAISRYDQRKLDEEQEANAIGTEYLRADLLAESDARVVKSLLAQYLDQRIAFYTSSDQPSSDAAAQLGTHLWSAVSRPALERPDPLRALVLSGINDVLNTEGYTQAVWWNRIPLAAWIMLGAIGVCANLLLGYSAQSVGRRRTLFLLILPLIVSVSLLLIADIDSPRGGFIQVRPQNLVRLAQSLRPR